MNTKWITAAKDGGANSKVTKMPPVSEEYRQNWEEIFGKPPVSGSTDTIP